jgi:hypothetical protein
MQFISHENCKDILTGLKESVITSIFWWIDRWLLNTAVTIILCITRTRIVYLCKTSILKQQSLYRHVAPLSWLLTNSSCIVPSSYTLMFRAWRRSRKYKLGTLIWLDRWSNPQYIALEVGKEIISKLRRIAKRGKGG